MFDKILDWIASVWGSLMPFTVLPPYEAAAIARLGIYHRSLGPGGFHWMWPFGIEEQYSDIVVRRTTSLAHQSLETTDGGKVTVWGVVTWEIVDIKKATLDCDKLDTTLRDTFFAMVGDAISSTTIDAVMAPGFSATIMDSAKDEAAEYGVRVIRFRFGEATEARPFRLLQG